jgi:signal transduction histidine kinase
VSRQSEIGASVDRQSPVRRQAEPPSSRPRARGLSGQGQAAPEPGERAPPRRRGAAGVWDGWLRYFWRPVAGCGAVFIVVAAALLNAQSVERAKLADNFNLRTTNIGQLLEAYLANQESVIVARAEDMLAARSVTRQQLKLAATGLGYQAAGVLDTNGRVLVIQPFAPSLIGRNFAARYENVRIAVQENRPGVTQAAISPVLRVPGVGIAVPYRTAYGRRIFGSTITLQGPTLNTVVRQANAPGGGSVYLIDRNGNLIAATAPLGATITPLSKLASALARRLVTHPAGGYERGGQEYRYASTPVAGTGGWRVISAVASSRLFAPLDAGATATYWTLVGLLVAAVLVAMMLGLGARRRAEAKARLVAANAELEQRVNERTQELRVSNDELEAFVYSVSHDLRAPLRSMDGFSRVLLEDYSMQLDEQGRHYLLRMREGARRMGWMIDELLQISRVARGVMHREQVDLSSLARQIASELQSSEPDRRVRFEIAEGLTASGDPELIRIVLENLLSNAWKFTSQHEHATIEVGETKHDGHREFFIRDDGAGFDMEYADQLFGPFQRLHRTDEFSGTGVGLASVKRIVARHGGHIRGEGQVEHGATFRFTLEPDGAPK